MIDARITFETLRSLFQSRIDTLEAKASEKYISNIRYEYSLYDQGMQTRDRLVMNCHDLMNNARPQPSY